MALPAEVKERVQHHLDNAVNKSVDLEDPNAIRKAIYQVVLAVQYILSNDS